MRDGEEVINTPREIRGIEECAEEWMEANEGEVDDN